MANKTVKITRNNNLFSEQTQIFICHFKHVFFPANEGGSELEWKLLCLCFTHALADT